MFQSILGMDQKKTATAQFHIEGMSCASCVARVEKAIRQLPGIDSLTIDLASGKATIAYDVAKVSPEQIRDKVLAAGYKVNDS